jgi:hypothetical protein
LDSSGGTGGGIISSGEKVGWHVITPFQVISHQYGTKQDKHAFEGRNVHYFKENYLRYIPINNKQGCRSRFTLIRILRGLLQKSRVVDPDPDWIRIQRLFGSGSVFGIRIPDPDPGARKLRNTVSVEKCTF